MTNPRNELFDNNVYSADLNLLRIKWTLDFDDTGIIGLSFYPRGFINVSGQKLVVSLLSLHFRFPLREFPDRCYRPGFPMWHPSAKLSVARNRSKGKSDGFCRQDHARQHEIESEWDMVAFDVAGRAVSRTHRSCRLHALGGSAQPGRAIGPERAHAQCRASSVTIVSLRLTTSSRITSRSLADE